MFVGQMAHIKLIVLSFGNSLDRYRASARTGLRDFDLVAVYVLYTLDPVWIGRAVVSNSMPQSKESSRFFSVEAVALPNLPQTFRGRERSKRGYATPLLVQYFN